MCGMLWGDVLQHAYFIRRLPNNSNRCRLKNVYSNRKECCTSWFCVCGDGLRIGNYNCRPSTFPWSWYHSLVWHHISRHKGPQCNFDTQFPPQKEAETGSVENKPRPGGLRKLTSRAKRMIVRSATNKPMTSAQNFTNELLSSCNVSVSAQTVRNVLHRTGLKSISPRKKPYISEVNRKRRLEFAMKYKNKPMDFWKKGCVAHNGAGNLAFIVNKMNALAYIDVLRHNLLDSAKKLIMENTFIFQQHNDPKHTAIATKTWLLYHAPRRLETSPQSPDLNPIENLWMHLDTEVL
ncbi:uncharacterized protein TNCV_1430611 [Trichonephila clavipes]|nr:uncharacterized protein TNCV_1430611 [Trichonephila clavipes]